jgi:MFS family permease
LLQTLQENQVTTQAAAEMLFEYTKFHIGLYSTVAAALAALLTGKFAEGRRINRVLVLVGMGCTAVAGMAGGVIAASLPYYVNHRHFWRVKVGVWGREAFTIREWTFVEHGAFWLAIVCIALAVLPGLRRPTPPAACWYCGAPHDL